MHMDVSFSLCSYWIFLALACWLNVWRVAHSNIPNDLDSVRIFFLPLEMWGLCELRKRSGCTKVSSRHRKLLKVMRYSEI